MWTKLPRWTRLRTLRALTTTAWAAYLTATITGEAHPALALPIRVHILTGAACVALTAHTAWHRSQAPVRAAFLDGAIYGRQQAANETADDNPPPLARAAGDDLATVTPLAAGRHRPSPRRR